MSHNSEELELRQQARQMLSKVWGYTSFRPLQEDIILSVLQGHDTLALLPTGGGKSITFQVPALLSPGVTVVITPLVALMRDQVERLHKLNVKATYLHAGMSGSMVRTTLDNCLYGDYKLLYVSPERLQTPLFKQRIQSLNVSLLVVDESHCISQWGYDFRPSYLRILEFRELIPNVPCLALTATAPPKVVADIWAQLGFSATAKMFRKSFYRTALSYVVRETANKIREMIHILHQVPGSALVYVRSRKESKDIAEELQQHGFSADYFHAGLSAKEKGNKQKLWQQGQLRIMVCTTAFGMGIDKDNVRLVIHPSLPATPEGYYQEAGRAGRDNQRSYAILLFDRSRDVTNAFTRLQKSYPPLEQIRNIYDSMCNYFQLAVGFGEGTLHEMNIFAFSKVFRYSSFQVYSALNLLTLAGYIEYKEDVERPSRLQFLVERNELYDLFDQENTLYDNIIEQLLRNYEGLFTEEATINEEALCASLHIPHETLYQALLYLSKIHVIRYVPGKRSNFVRMLQIRLPKERIRIPSAVYQERYQAEASRLQQMVDYVQEDTNCRVRHLIGYFGEEDTKPCGWCDYCLQHPPTELSYRQIDQLLHELNIQLPTAQESIGIQDLKHLCQLDLPKLKEALQFIEQQGHPYTFTPNGMVVRK